MRELPKIARERLAAGPAPAPHLDSNLISAFVEHALLPSERQRVIAHMAACEDCRAEVQLVISATRPEGRGGEAARDLTAASASRFYWQRLRRWQPMAAAAGVLAISAAFWVATRQPSGVHPAAPLMLERKAAPRSSPAENSGPATVRLQAPAPSSEAKQTLALSKSHEGAGTGKAAMMKSAEQKSSNQSAGELVSEKAQSPALLQTDARQTEALVVAAPPPPAPAPAPAAAQRILSASAAQPLTAQTASTAMVSGAAPARGIERPPAVMSLERKLAAASKVPPRQMAQLSIQLGVRWAVGPGTIPAQPNAGAVEKSLDGGRTWQPVTVAQGVIFRVVFALGREVWAGGVAGAFYHSSDGGEHWSFVPLATSSGAASGDIVSIQFADAPHGVVSASSGQTWTTSDGGKSWQPK
jgi:hypothetical protein